MKITDILENTEVTDTSHHKLITDPVDAFHYTKDVIKGRWPEAEPIIMTEPHYAYYYARDVINKGKSEKEPKIRWKEAEPIIMTDTFAASGYYKYIMIPSVLKSNPNSKRIFRLLMDITKYCNEYKDDYDKLIKLIFPDSSIMVDKWINYGNNQRGKK